jgi:oxygen-independent coproporphyrinogen-3 oxidase
MYQAARERFATAGMEQYEISNFAFPGYRCRHNLAYWEGRGWFAAGPGAARFCHGRRQVNHRSPTAYIKRCLAGQDPTAEDEPLDRRQWAAERAAFGVRMLAGIDLETLHRETGYDIAAACAEDLQRLENEGLLARDGTRIRLTERGILFADSVASVLLAA